MYSNYIIRVVATQFQKKFGVMELKEPPSELCSRIVFACPYLRIVGSLYDVINKYVDIYFVACFIFIAE